jgi:hypothetical protein
MKRDAQRLENRRFESETRIVAVGASFPSPEPLAPSPA